MLDKTQAPTSKIVEITRFVNWSSNQDSLIALCEDGSLWETRLGSIPPYWHCISRFDGNQYEYSEKTPPVRQGKGIG
ncbi:MAG: hypothetical protein IJ187_05810 [Neisseriaceae bacterium]|nr:hypothetical protein [Neisseriaceae bacterium]MBQ9724005.1 hypothetical protein [Neisseriaceae bacterium]